jgi:hypothetical protein
VRDGVGAEDAMAEFAHLDTAVWHGAQLGDPGAHGVEALGHLGRGRALEDQPAWKQSARR